MRLAAPPGMSRVNVHPPPRALAPEPSLALHHWSDSALREAEHAEAVGHIELAAERYVEAANHAVKIGGCVRAIDLVERALRLLDRATTAASHRSLRIAALITMGRAMRLAAQSGNDEYRLPSALAALESAASLLVARDHVELRAELAQIMAQVYYDMGGDKQLMSALALLVQARRALLEAGLPLEAARMLSDEASVRARRGELAQTEQIMARLAPQAGTHDREERERIDSASR